MNEKDSLRQQPIAPGLHSSMFESCVISLHSVESELSQPSRRATSSGSSMAGPFRVAACRSFGSLSSMKPGNPAAIPHGDGGFMHFLCVDGGSLWFS